MNAHYSFPAQSGLKLNCRGFNILVVDDSRFPSAMVRHILLQAGYQHVQVVSSAREALKILALQPAHVVLADWMMPEMDGLELTARIRQQDLANNHYTYIILLTSRETQEAQVEAFEQGVDDFINKSTTNKQLLPRIKAAERLCYVIHSLQQENLSLRNTLYQNEQELLLDELTGLGSPRGLREKLNNSLKQISSQGGALCYLLISMATTPAFSTYRYKPELYQEIQQIVAHRLRHYFPPGDTLFRLDAEHFVGLLLLNTQTECRPSAYQHLLDSINQKPLNTSAGSLNIYADIAMVSLDSRALPITPQEIMVLAQALLPSTEGAGRIVPAYLPVDTQQR